MVRAGRDWTNTRVSPLGADPVCGEDSPTCAPGVAPTRKGGSALSTPRDLVGTPPLELARGLEGTPEVILTVDKDLLPAANS